MAIFPFLQCALYLTFLSICPDVWLDPLLISFRLSKVGLVQTSVIYVERSYAMPATWKNTFKKCINWFDSLSVQYVVKASQGSKTCVAIWHLFMIIRKNSNAWFVATNTDINATSSNIWKLHIMLADLETCQQSLVWIKAVFQFHTFVIFLNMFILWRNSSINCCVGKIGFMA